MNEDNKSIIIYKKEDIMNMTIKELQYFINNYINKVFHKIDVPKGKNKQYYLDIALTNISKVNFNNVFKSNIKDKKCIGEIYIYETPKNYYEKLGICLQFLSEFTNCNILSNHYDLKDIDIHTLFDKIITFDEKTTHTKKDFKDIYIMNNKIILTQLGWRHANYLEISIKNMIMKLYDDNTLYIYSDENVSCYFEDDF